MAQITHLEGTHKLKEAYPLINGNLDNINNELVGHINSTTAHKAEDITYAGEVIADDVKEAIDKVNERVGTIIAGAGESNTEILDARYDKFNAITYENLGARLDGVSSSLADETNEINALKAEKYIFFGDSYAQGWTPDGTVKSWCRHTKDMLKLSDENFYDFFTGGYGFVNDGFKTLLTNAINTIQDKQNIKHIIVGGGYNDATEERLPSLASKMAEWIGLCKSNFPNARILVAPFGWCVEGLTTDVHVDRKISSLIKMVLEYQRNALINGACYIDGIYSVLHRNGFFSSDFVHPNSNGQYNIALALSNYLRTGGFNTIEYMSDATNMDCFKNNVYEAGITCTIKCYGVVDGKNTVLNLSKGEINGVFDNITLNGSNILLGTVKSATVNGMYSKTSFNFPAILKSVDGKYYKMTVTLSIISNKLYINITSINNTNANFDILSFVQIKIYEPPAPIIINSLIN